MLVHYAKPQKADFALKLFSFLCCHCELLGPFRKLTSSLESDTMKHKLSEIKYYCDFKMIYYQYIHQSHVLQLQQNSSFSY
ncbi:hypothetical protein T02_910 [Trichinella nativa]|uniref:Uncharacterized protein n=1 Tax=Trichinella nativa TaxID=6335 RepID=A0A0V1LQG7_9BILA|nr:hypothetical protein T02_910 [Trichinella nativa]